MWLPKARQFVRKVIFHCLVCKRLNGPCYGVPRQADLPDFRVQEQPAFSKVGVDFGGPIYINPISTVGRCFPCKFCLPVENFLGFGSIATKFGDFS